MYLTHTNYNESKFYDVFSRKIKLLIREEIFAKLNLNIFFQKVRANSPSVELFRSIDYYMLFCNLFVFAALAETTLIGMTAPNSKPVTAAQQMMDIMQNDDDDEEEENMKNTKPSVRNFNKSLCC